MNSRRRVDKVISINIAVSREIYNSSLDGVLNSENSSRLDDI